MLFIKIPTQNIAVARQGQYHWVFGTFLKNQPSLHFKDMLSTKKLLELYYRILCASLHKQLQQEKSNSIKENKLLLKQVVSALMLAESLAYLNKHYLALPTEAQKLEQEQAHIRTLLTIWHPIHFPKQLAIKSPFHEQVRHWVSHYIWPRLLLFRSRNFILATINCFKYSPHATVFIKSFDRVIFHGLTAVGCALHGTRLLINLFDLMLHVIPGPWMSQSEKQLGVFYRLSTHVKRYWLEILHDIVKIINLFMAWSIIVNVIVMMTDLITLGLPRILDIIQLLTLREQIKADVNTPTEHLSYVNARLRFEFYKLMLVIVNAVCVNSLNILRLSIPLMITLTAVNPIIPAVITGLVLVVMLSCYFLNARLDKYKPVDTLKHPQDFKNISIYSSGLTHFSPRRQTHLIAHEVTSEMSMPS